MIVVVFLRQVVPTLYTDIRGHKIATNQVWSNTSGYISEQDKVLQSLGNEEDQ
jgi:hypothetical protein